ncbi:MAG: YwaF family protein [Clostridia bacterium]|nr:YwaF family protein [Clostridia bacterium]
MDYHFFDYKHDISGFESDLFSVPHIVFIALVYVLGILVSFLFRKARHERIGVGLKVLSIWMVVFEITKITWESVHDINHGYGFNYEGILPLYTCSLFIYALLVAAWGKGKPREFCLSFLTTIGMLYGAIGVVYCNGLNFYPFWTFGAFYSMFFHATMFVTGVFLLMTGYKKAEWRDVYRSFVPIVLLACVAVPVNYYLNGPADYMLLYSGSGVPFYQDIAQDLGAKGLRFIYTILMLVTHLPLAALVVGITKLIGRIFGKKAGAAANAQE